MYIHTSNTLKSIGVTDSTCVASAQITINDSIKTHETNVVQRTRHTERQTRIHMLHFL